MAITINGSTGITSVNGSTGTPSYTGADTDTGIYFPTVNQVAIVAGGSESASIDSSSNFKFNSGYGSAATAYGCRAWVNFNGQGTVAIRASGNVSSITDLSLGYYAVNMTNSMPDTNYTVVATLQHFNTVTKITGVSGADFNSTISAFSIFTWYNSGDFDPSTVNVAVFR